MLNLSGQAAQRDALRFDWLVSLASFWWVAGVVLDGWAHLHVDLHDEGFFTPYHGVLYSGYLATAAVVGWKIWSGMRAGVSFRQAIPAGYGPTVAGLALMLVGGFGDMLWHLAFGIEQALSAALSPSHLLLFFAGSLAFLGPTRALAARGGAPSLGGELPALLGFVYFLTSAGFLTEWTMRVTAGAPLAPAVRFAHADPALLGELAYYVLGYGILTLALRGTLLAGVALYVARAYPVRPGALTLAFGLSATFTTLMRAGADPLALTLSPGICAGLVADVAILLLEPGRGALWRLQVLGFLVPFTFVAVNLAIVGALFGGYWWEVHVVSGTAVFAGFCGLLVASLMQPRAPAPVLPNEA